MQPILIGHAIGVRVSNDFTRGHIHAHIAGNAQAPIRLAMTTHGWIPFGNRSSRVGRSIVGPHHFVVRVVQFSEGFKTALQRRGTVVGTDHNGYAWIPFQLWKWTALPPLSHLVKCVLRRSVASNKPKRPILDVTVI